MTGAIYTLWLRSIKRFIRSKSRIIGSLAQPLFFLIILGFGLNSVMSLPGTGSYVKFMVPGIVSMTVMFSSIFSGIQIIWDKQFGFLKETLIAPVSRTSIMFGQTIGGATTALIQGTLTLILAMFVAGLTSFSLYGFLIAFVFMILIGLSFTALGIAIASKMEDMHGFQLIMNFLMFPLFFLSGALFPLSNAPIILKTIAHFNPLSYGVEGVRYGLLGTSEINPLLSFIVLVGFTVFIVILGGYFFKKVNA
ncbi:MAG: ABC transporter permease [Candidatus Nanoarchaeia archaeon]|nr:ABC transporter permease [Candidatus Nanoarchaeia archaeon]MDD5588374.1 ABC transporter permease [Candidatus Nanoarchaeia archaeon]